MTPTTLTEIVARGDLFGYLPEPPPSPSAIAVDRELCEALVCQHCGHRGLSYEPFVRHSTGSYRVFAVCPSCAATVEV
ncbi:MAG: hypothetical protein JO086_00155 [Acidimicrobiia bacterium]|nr:hypothetical protein [Acidimicrobiia bacterium]